MAPKVIELVLPEPLEALVVLETSESLEPLSHSISSEMSELLQLLSASSVPSFAPEP